MLVSLQGYANEVGEAFRSLVPGWAVGASYALATAYVVADTAHKAHLTWKVREEGEDLTEHFDVSETIYQQSLSAVG